jgi:hypothetical protein
MKLFNKKMNKAILSKIKSGEFSLDEIRNLLHTISIQELREIGKEIIYVDYDGYNSISKKSEMLYFDNLGRWQKEFFVKERLYKIL